MTNPDSRVIGAFAVGVALVGGAYLMQNFGSGGGQFGEPQIQDFAVVNQPMERVALAVTDSNNDGIEDWREEWLTGSTIRLSSSSEGYVEPETLTDRLGVTMMERVIINQNPINQRSKEEIVDILAREALKETGDNLYTALDIEVVDDTPENIRAYGNGAAMALKNNAVIVSTNELDLLNDYIHKDDEKAREELIQLRDSMLGYRDDTLALPVPRSLVKPHLDLVNVYNAIYNSFDVFVNANQDPLLTLVRLQRYLDDLEAHKVALNNMYDALLVNASAFETDDPAVLFVRFANPAGV